MTFYMRPGVTFHDGSAVDAAAVKASIERAIDLPGSQLATYATNIKSIVVDTAYSFTVNTYNGSAALPWLFASNVGTVINPKCISSHISLTMPPTMCSSGPYLVNSGKTQIPGNWWFTRVPGKFWQAGAANAKYFQITTVFPAQQGITALLAGDLDITMVTPDAMKVALGLVKSGRFEGSPVGISGLFMLEFNTHRPPFNNLVLRQAVQHAINPSGIEELFQACPLSYQPAKPGSPFFDPTFLPNQYDPAKVKALLAQAGVPTGFKFTLTTSEFAPDSDAAQVYASELSAAGITATVNVVPFTSTAISTGDFEAQSTGGFFVPDPADAMSYLFDVGSGFAAPAVGSPVEREVRILAQDALNGHLTLAEQGKYYQQIWKLGYQQAWWTGSCNQEQLWLHGSNVLNANAPDIGAGQINPRFLALTE